MEVKWTDEQLEVIKSRDKNVLVSAAAGSGKTAVLVERIIRRVVSQDNPVDIDKILVVTFTKAAAAEMRERIGKVLDREIEKNPEDVRIIRQATLLHNAKITTIDSFCSFVVKNHFEEINLDPRFRIAENGEIKLLEKDVLDQIFEKNYSREGNEAFLQLVENYSSSRSDANVREMVENIYQKSQSSSWPGEWISSLLLPFESGEDDFEGNTLISALLRDTGIYLEHYKKELTDIRALAESTAGFENYAQTLSADIELFQEIDELKTYDEYRDFLSNIKFSTLKRLGSKDIDISVKNYISDKRKEIKSGISDLLSRKFAMTRAMILEQNARIYPYVRELVRLSLEYLDAMDSRKRQKKIATFSDIEHFALEIFVDKDSKSLTDVARSFSEQFEEIMIDEYQDSNQVQEDILCAISREHCGGHNMFMVGDVKQSIYRFRMARPELFMDKYDRYSFRDPVNQRIDLHKNFRSRREVIEFTNDIFYKIMGADIGKVQYDDEAALYEGADYPPAEGMKAEVCLVDLKDQMLENVLEEEDKDARRIEALMAAQKIKNIVGSFMVTDSKTRQLRSAKYSDIVILFRSLSQWGDTFSEVLSDCGIPNYVESSTGYFAAYEIDVILNMLQILDNPYQDIPMAAVLKSPLAGLTDEELAEIRIVENNLGFSKAALKMMEDADDGPLHEFNKLYQDLRKEVKDTSIHLLIEHLLHKSGFDNYVAAMPAGERRMDNINQLLDRAIAYEKTSYKGLFHFVRYIEALKKYEVDYGEANALGEGDDVVRIMTIHKSKGLEFPICFISGISKEFNNSDSKGSLLLHSDLGIGLEEISGRPKRKIASLYRNQIADIIRAENLAEEQRVLYVALTRAKEKLILTGTVKDYGKYLSRIKGSRDNKSKLSYVSRMEAKSYMDWLIAAILSYGDKYEISLMEASNLARRVTEDMVISCLDESQVRKEIEKVTENEIGDIDRRLEFEYPYQVDLTKKSKYSVSELKHNSMVEKFDSQENQAARPDFLAEERESYIPEFAISGSQREMSVDSSVQEYDKTSHDKDKSGVSRGALRGTAVHRVLECMDFKAFLELEGYADEREKRDAVSELVKSQIKSMLDSGRITEDMQSLVKTEALVEFVSSGTGHRMAVADSRGLLFKEKPFVMQHEDYLVQGIIDVFWLEGDGIVLLDYKTDRVKTAEELIMRYKTQLELYGDALERVFSTENKTVKTKECLIYSFRLQEVIEI